MLVQIGLEGEGLAAALARERFQIGMSLNVSAQVGLVGEGFVADLAAERLLTCATNPQRKIFSFLIQFRDVRLRGTCVSSNVSLQQPGPGEGLAAVRTLAALAVCAHVHREGWNGHVHLVAVWTPPGLSESKSN